MIAPPPNTHTHCVSYMIEFCLHRKKSKQFYGHAIKKNTDTCCTSLKMHSFYVIPHIELQSSINIKF